MDGLQEATTARAVQRVRLTAVEATVRIAVRTCADVAHPASSFTDDDRQFATLSVHRCRRVHPPSIGTSSASSVI